MTETATARTQKKECSRGYFKSNRLASECVVKRLLSLLSTASSA